MLCPKQDTLSSALSNDLTQEDVLEIVQTMTEKLSTET